MHGCFSGVMHAGFHMIQLVGWDCDAFVSYASTLVEHLCSRSTFCRTIFMKCIILLISATSVVNVVHYYS